MRVAEVVIVEPDGTDEHTGHQPRHEVDHDGWVDMLIEWEGKRGAVVTEVTPCVWPVLRATAITTPAGVYVVRTEEQEGY